jgi:hypothetical protein
VELFRQNDWDRFQSKAMWVMMDETSLINGLRANDAGTMKSTIEFVGLDA